MDRRNYDRKVIGVFETVGCYFVDVFYNRHYLLAMEAVKNGKIPSITDGYRSNIFAYMNGIKQDGLFKKAVHALHEFYQKSTGFVMLLSEFQNHILAQFIPLEFYKDFTEQRKDNTLRDIVIHTVSEFGNIVLGNNIFHKIIDDHKNVENVSFLQDRIVDIFIMQRENYYSKFARKVTKPTGKIDQGMLNKLRDAWSTEKKRTIELETENKRALSMMQQLVKKIRDIEAENTELKNTNTTLTADNKTLARQLQRMQATTQHSTQYPTQHTPPTVQSTNKPALDDSEEDLSDGEIHRRQQQRLAQQKSTVKTEPPPLDVTLDDVWM
jgi:hypothetical protein